MNKLYLRKTDELDYYGTESMNTICSNLMFIGTGMKKIAFTSCRPSDGKTFISVQVAMNLAERGKNVVYVDADMRRSRMLSRYGAEFDGEMKGLAHYLAGMTRMKDIVYQTNVEGLYIVPYGREVVNSVSLLDGAELGELLNGLAAEFDMVIVDTPPIGLIIDAALIARECDGVIFVTKFNFTHRRWLESAQEQIRSSGCKILGCIINEVHFDTLTSRGYYGKYYTTYDSHYSKGYYNNSEHSSSSRKARPMKISSTGLKMKTGSLNTAHRKPERTADGTAEKPGKSSGKN